MLELHELLTEEEEPLLERNCNHEKNSKMDSSTTGSLSTVDSQAPLTRRGTGHRSVQMSPSATGQRSNTLGRSSNRTKTPFMVQCISGITRFLTSCWSSSDDYQTREFRLGKPPPLKYCPNIIKNQKYNIITFLPLVLFQQFRFFLNMYFLVMACSQFFPDVRIGYWYTYWGPLIFVLTVTLIREWVDDFRRMQRDKEINSQKYYKLIRGERAYIPSLSIKVGDLVVIEKDQRIPADMILLRTSDRNGRCFIRTDQLDGETDWKLRLPLLQDVESDGELLRQRTVIYAEKPQKDIHSFIGSLTKRNDIDEIVEEVPISLENTLWANTVLAAGEVVGVVVYTGSETRSVMNNSKPRSKFGLTDLEINDLTKILFLAVVGLAFLMMCLKGFEGPWYRYMFRFVLLFSYIIPISLRVNMDMAKTFYAWSIQRDQNISGTVVRSTTIPEDLGRISYLLTDKTGTLTQNEMVFRRLHLATCQYDSASDVSERLREAHISMIAGRPGSGSESYTRVNEVTRVSEAVKALAICHNVTPVYEEPTTASFPYEDDEMVIGMEREATLQASSPDEIALVKFSNEAGLVLLKRDQSKMWLKQTDTQKTTEYNILHIFPFTSETKRMGIIIQDPDTDQIILYLKGADTVMKNIVKYNDWLDEACGNMAREGLRTLAVAKKVFTPVEYVQFDKAYLAAKCSKIDRTSQMVHVMSTIERDMDLLCVTGVEDTLQVDVKVTLETLRNAGIKIWMLTGDKLETATCIAKSSKLVSSQQEIYTFRDKSEVAMTACDEETGETTELSERAHAFNELNNYRRRTDAALIIRGETLQVCLESYEKEFMELACSAPVVVVCRCSPTQKALVVELVQKHTGKRTAAIGDGGNDVAMIQAANAGIGIEGKEGRQASLAADFSITQFSFVSDLLLVHGRYCYKRSAALAQFVMHRGLIITVMQAVFSSIFYFSSVALYQGFLMIGYATVYTMFPVFALVLDKDVTEQDLRRLPELYSELGKGRSLTYKTFFLWVLISVFQGGVIMYGALILFQDEFIHIVSISFTSLILTELIMVALTIRSMHRLMLIAELTSLLFYVGTLVVFHEFFDSNFILSIGFFWKVVVITGLSCVPIYIGKYIRQFVSPPSYTKLS